MIYLIFALALTYFTMARRRIDFYTVATFSSLIYFLPGLAGYTFYVFSNQVVYTPINGEMVFIYCSVVFALLAGAILNDYTSGSPAVALKPINRSEKRLFYLSATLIWAYFAVTHLDDLLLGRKEVFGSLYAVAFTSIAFVFVMALANKDWRWVTLFSLIALVELYAGNREMIAFVLIAYMIVAGLVSPRLRIFSKFRFVLPAFAALSLLLIYKQLGAVIIAGKWGLVVDRLGDPTFLVAAVSRSEPFVTQTILYSATEFNWQFEGSLLLNLSIILMPMGRLFSSEVSSISAFLNNSFGDVGYGVGSNVWAEAFVLGGMPMVIVFLICYATLPAVLNRLARNSNSLLVRIFLAFIGVAFLFFIHRTGVEYAFNVVKRFALFTFLMHVGYVFLVKGGAGK